MSTPRLTFLYPFLFASTKPSVSRSASRTVTRGFRATCGAHQHNTVNQRYGTANEPPPHLGGGQAIPMGAPKVKDAAPKDAKALPKPPPPPKEKEPQSPYSSEPKAKAKDTKQDKGSSKETEAASKPAKGTSTAAVLDATESRPADPPPPSPHLPSTNPLEAVLHMPSSESQAQATAPVYSDEEGHAHASLNGSDAQKPPHISTPPYVHHFDTYGLVRRLEEGGWTQPQAVTIMKAVRLILASNMELAREGLVSRSNVENETYLFRAACSELRTELTTKRKAESERQRSERTQLQHEVDILGQRLTQEGGNLKDELKGMFDDRKMGVRNEQRDMDRKIQELNYRITVSLNSDSRSEVEGLRWVITKRAITALAVCVTMILSSLKFSSSMMHIQEEERKNMAAMDKEGKGKGREERKEKEEQVIGAGEMLVQQGDNPAFCDETRPTCQKCAIHGVPCPGYRTPQPGGIEFLDQTSLVVNKAKAREAHQNSYSPRSACTASLSPNSSTPEPEAAVIPYSKTPESTASPIVFEVPNAFQNRLQTFQKFLELYTPEEELLPAGLCHFSNMGSFTEYLQSNQPAVQAALDTLMLVQLGTTYNDPRFLYESRRRYGEALGSLSRLLVQPKTAYIEDALAAVYLLGNCEFYENLHQEGSWNAHISGLQSLFKLRGPKPLNTKYELMLFHHARHLTIIRGYISRKRSFFEAPEWLEISKEGSQTDMMTRLLDIAIKVPGLLEDTDNALGSGDEALAMKVMTDVVDALQRFHHWLTRWHDAIGEESYHLQDIEEFPAFVETCDDRTFPKAFKFRSFQNGYLHCKYWLCRCFLQKAIMDLLARYPNLPCAWTPKEIDQDLLGDAINICQAIPYFCQPAASSTGRFSTFVPLRFVTLFFEARKMRAQQRWGEKVAATIYSQGIAPPSLRQGYFLWRPYLYGK